MFYFRIKSPYSGKFGSQLARKGFSRPLFVLFTLFFFISLALPVTAFSGENLIIAGSGSNLDGIRVLAEKFQKQYPDIRIKVPSSLGSTGGIQAVMEGAISIGLISRPLTANEKKKGLTVLPYALTPVVIGVHSSVPDDGITSDELIEIYSGEKTKWKNGKEIIVLTRQPNDSSLAILQQKIPGFKNAYVKSMQEKSWLVLYTDQDMNNALSRIPNAIGFTDSCAIKAAKLDVKFLELNGVYPSARNAAEGKYPYVKALSFVFKKNKLTPGAKSFMDFVTGEKGLKILKKLGYLPPK